MIFEIFLELASIFFFIFCILNYYMLIYNVQCSNQYSSFLLECAKYWPDYRLCLPPQFSQKRGKEEEKADRDLA